MDKLPQVGRVKTRLASETGGVRAAWFYRHTVAAVLARLSNRGTWKTVLAVTPDSGVTSRIWSATVMRKAQGGGDLGARMQRIMGWRSTGPVIIVGSDIPAIRPSHIAAAFKALGGNDAVFGPARDGGYWLVGQRRRPHLLRMFNDVRWSSPHALSDSLANLDGQRVALIATLSDVDDAGELSEVAAWCGRRILPIPVGT